MASRIRSFVMNDLATPTMVKIWSQIRSFIINDLTIYVFFMAFVGTQLWQFTKDYMAFRASPKFVLLQRETNGALSVARATAGPIRLTTAVVLVPICRNLVSYTRFFLCRYTRFFRFFDKSLVFHRVCAWCILFWVFIHVVSHMQNYFNVERVSNKNQIPGIADYIDGRFISRYEIAFSSISGFTGLVMVSVMFVMYTSSLERIRRSYFEVFWYTHHMFIIFYGALLPHATGRFLQGIKPTGEYSTGGAPVYMWVLASLFAYMLERLLRWYRSTLHVELVKIVQHPSKTFEIQMRRKGFVHDAGQYIFIQCSNVSILEWHPFTLTSSPEEDFFSLHIRVAGDWTTALAKQLGCDWDAKDGPITPSPNTVLKVDGPFGTASEDAFSYEVAVFVGAGIGVTPFASLLKSMWYQHMQGINLKVKKVYFYWLARDKESFEWFSDLLDALEDQMTEMGRCGFIESKVYLTQRLQEEDIQHIVLTHDEQSDTITGLKTKTFFGRPQWDKELTTISQEWSGRDIGVFFCGSKIISTHLHKACNRNSNYATNTQFFYNKENF